MKVAIHQPHYFPWMGYLDKMAKSEKFILLDEVQLTDKSNMFRNKFCTTAGKEKFLTVCFEKKEYMNKKFKDVKLNSTIDWQKDHINFIKENYKKTKYFEEIFPEINFIFNKEYTTLCQVTIDSLLCLKRIFDIPTNIVLQSELNYNQESKKNDLVLELCKSVDASYYLSGNGARKYMDIESFEKAEIKVVYQNFTYPVYIQTVNQSDFVPNLSALDLLFNCGIDNSRDIFWENVKTGMEF